MLTLDFCLDEKAIGEDGRVSGLAASYGNVDEGGDMIVPGAMSKALAGVTTLPMLMYHDQQKPIGVWDKLRETAKGLEVSGRFTLATAHGREAYELTKDGALTGLSIGYRATKERQDGAVRRLEQLKLYEVSLVAVPMNLRARVSSVKTLFEDGRLPTEREFETFLRDAGGFPKSLAVALASRAKPILRGEPEDEGAAFLAMLRDAGIDDLTGED